MHMTREQAFRTAFTNARVDLAVTRDKGSVKVRPPVTPRRIPKWRMTA